ncbi:hypothetical protein Droror1_Dr00014765 [Drosera rotundifolia]
MGYSSRVIDLCTWFPLKHNGLDFAEISWYLELCSTYAADDLEKFLVADLSSSTSHCSFIFVIKLLQSNQAVASFLTNYCSSFCNFLQCKLHGWEEVFASCYCNVET